MTHPVEQGKEVNAAMKINDLPVRTWHWLAMNESHLSAEDTQQLEAARQEDPIMVHAGKGEKAARTLLIACPSGEATRQHAELAAGQGSALTVWMELSSAADAQGFLALTTSIRAGERAKVRLVQVQLLGAGCDLLNNVRIECAEGAAVEILQLFLGGASAWTALQCELNGAESSLLAETGYWLRGTQRLDMNHVTVHRAKKTSSQLLAKGVLDDQAFKLFRGTIDFQQGAAGAEGAETEDVLMLGEGAVSQTIPIILCGEEDVQGNHGATIGEVDDDVLFYLAARGLHQAEALHLLAQMKIESLRTQIGNKALEEKVYRYMKEATGHADG